MREAIVEAATPRARYMCEHAIERDAAFFVRVEAFIQKITQKAAILRNAFPINALCRRNGIGSVLRIGRKIANGREPSAGNYRIGNHIYIFVNLPG